MKRRPHGGIDRETGIDSLRPWAEVRRMWCERSGETISRERVQQIADEAMTKLREVVFEHREMTEP